MLFFCISALLLTELTMVETVQRYEYFKANVISDVTFSNNKQNLIMHESLNLTFKNAVTSKRYSLYRKSEGKRA